MKTVTLFADWEPKPDFKLISYQVFQSREDREHVVISYGPWAMSFGQ